MMRATRNTNAGKIPDKNKQKEGTRKSTRQLPKRNDMVSDDPSKTTTTDGTIEKPSETVTPTQEPSTSKDTTQEPSESPKATTQESTSSVISEPNKKKRKKEELPLEVGQDYESLRTYLQDHWKKPLKRVFIPFGNSRSIPSTYSSIQYAEGLWFGFFDDKVAQAYQNSSTNKSYMDDLMQKFKKQVDVVVDFGKDGKWKALSPDSVKVRTKATQRLCNKVDKKKSSKKVS